MHFDINAVRTSRSKVDSQSAALRITLRDGRKDARDTMVREGAR